MHILISLLGAAGMLILVLWRIRQATYVARDLADAAGEARGFFRRWKWRRKVNVNPIDLVTDPREAASILMVAVAQGDGPITEAERAAIQSQMIERFGATQRQAMELLTQSQWMVRDGVDTREIMRRLQPLVHRGTTPEQRRELVEMLTAVAEADGRHDEMTTFDIYHFARQISA